MNRAEPPVCPGSTHAAAAAPPGHAMSTDEIRKVVSDVIASIAPDFERERIEPARPLRQQVELDSMDWINVLSGLQERLQVDIPACDAGQLTTLDAIVGYLALRLAKPVEPAQARADAWTALPHAFDLADGTRVTVRPIRADDAALEAAFVRRLSAESRYMRFMATMRELPQPLLESLTDVDAVHHVALAATARRDDKEVLLGAARYVVDAAGTGCEFAVAVDDACQGSGLAGRLMQTLLEVARQRGLKRMEGTVLANNRRMLKFMRQLGFSVRRDPDDPHNVLVARAL
ncbi:MAG: GNAT family N-acetyltransferase [Burkholderiaceae bacterium]|nr:GNAT family N-acetyltransferase [Burkholderiaceae bacterium]